MSVLISGIAFIVIFIVLIIGGSFALTTHIRSTILSCLLCVIWTMAMVFVCRAFVVDVYMIPSESMTPTIAVGDNVLGNAMAARFSSYEVGNIVTFVDSNNPDRTLIKRIVADEGSVVDITSNGDLLVDGVKSPYQGASIQSTHLLDGGVSFPFTVGANEIFVMGDNRYHSADSRMFGSIPKNHVTSVVFLRVWPFDRLSVM